jgi:hypothetical protein
MSYEIIDTRAVSILYFKKAKLFFYTIKPNTEVSLLDIKEIFRVTKELAANDNVFSITDIRNLGFEHLPKEVTEYTAKNPFIKQQLKNAIIIEGIGQKIFGNFYLNVLRPARQTKLFNTHESALKWLGINYPEVLHVLSKYN